MLWKEGLRTESGISENIKVLTSIEKNKANGIGILLLMSDTLPQKFK